MAHRDAVRIIRHLFAAAGLACQSIAILAGRLGLDSDDRWGPSRRFLLFLGIGISAIALWPEIVSVSQATARKLSRLLTVLGERVLHSPTMGRLRERSTAVVVQPVTRALERPAPRKILVKTRTACEAVWRRTRNSLPARILFQDHRVELAAAVVAVAGVCAVYVWIVSVGTWTSWHTHTSYYDLLAQAFLQGQAHLPIEPDPGLAQLTNPYDHDARVAEQLDVLWDASYFEGDYYLYWGPAPALILAPIRAILDRRIGDQILVLAFSIGILTVCASILIRLRRKLFPTTPWWTSTMGILVAGLANPIPWVINRPAVYEAAITAGQFFLLAGLGLLILEKTTKRRSALRLLLAGTFLVLAVGSRRNLLFPATFMVLWRIGPEIVKARSNPAYLGRVFQQGLPLLTPLLAGGGFLLWYNRLRFGDYLEFGQRYQLSRANLNSLVDNMLSFSNILPNLQNYLINPFRTLQVFPFIKPNWGSHSAWMFHTVAPEHYYAEQVTGIMISLPLLVFAASPVLLLIRIGAGRLISAAKAEDRMDQPHEPIASVASLLIGTSVFAFLPLLLFLAATMRHLIDVVPSLILLSQLGVWMKVAHNHYEARPIWPSLAIALGLTTATVLIGILLAVTGYDARFEHMNPELFDTLTRMLTP